MGSQTAKLGQATRIPPFFLLLSWSSYVSVSPAWTLPYVRCVAAKSIFLPKTCCCDSLPTNQSPPRCYISVINSIQRATSVTIDTLRFTAAPASTFHVHVHVTSRPHLHPHPHPCPGAGAGPGADAGADKGKGAGAGTDTGAGAGVRADTRAGADTGASAGETHNQVNGRIHRQIHADAHAHATVQTPITPTSTHVFTFIQTQV
jgi:hypothetical protein